MNGSDRRRKTSDLLAALKLSKRAERWTRDDLHAHQRERARAMIAFAAEHSPLYRERLGARGAGTSLSDIEPIDKAELMERYDSLVTDPRLRRDDLLEFVETLAGEQRYLGEYRVMATSGSSGRKGLFVYDEDGWRAIMGQFLRQSAMGGVRPRLPRWRIAAILGAAPSHMSRQCGMSLDVGVHRLRVLSVTDPIEEIVAELNAFQPRFMGLYPSVASRLAEEQAAGRLRLSLAALTTSSDYCSPGLARRIEDVFGVRPHNLYATTEGLWGMDCDHRAGIHLFEDMTLVENVDENDRPVPLGEPGACLLVTNLANRVQPIIRLRLPDVMTFDPEPCDCGRPFVRVRSVDGRSDDVIELPGAKGAVTVLPMEFAMVSRDREVREFQVAAERDRLRLRIVAAGGADRDALAERLGSSLERRLAELGAHPLPAVDVEFCDDLPRTPGGKLQLVVAEPRRPGARMTSGV